MDVRALQQGLSNAADTIAGLRCYPTLPDLINPPAFAPVEFELAYHQTFGGLTDITFVCGVYVPNDPAGDKLLVGFVAAAGAGSIPAALESDKTLGGVAKTLVVQRVRGAGRVYSIGGNPYLGATIDVRVWA
jgi:hypothetical protein